MVKTNAKCGAISEVLSDNQSMKTTSNLLHCRYKISKSLHQRKNDRKPTTFLDCIKKPFGLGRQVEKSMRNQNWNNMIFNY